MWRLFVLHVYWCSHIVSPKWYNLQKVRPIMNTVELTTTLWIRLISFRRITSPLLFAGNFLGNGKADNFKSGKSLEKWSEAPSKERLNFLSFSLQSRWDILGVTLVYIPNIVEKVFHHAGWKYLLKKNVQYNKIIILALAFCLYRVWRWCNHQL